LRLSTGTNRSNLSKRSNMSKSSSNIYSPQDSNKTTFRDSPDSGMSITLRKKDMRKPNKTCMTHHPKDQSLRPTANSLKNNQSTDKHPISLSNSRMPNLSTNKCPFLSPGMPGNKVEEGTSSIRKAGSTLTNTIIESVLRNRVI